jgi:hypothetical protein
LFSSFSPKVTSSISVFKKHRLFLGLPKNRLTLVMTILACVAGPQFYGGPDLQRAGFWQALPYIQYLNFLYVSQAANKTLKGMFSALSDNVKLC